MKLKMVMKKIFMHGIFYLFIDVFFLCLLRHFKNIDMLFIILFSNPKNVSCM